MDNTNRKKLKRNDQVEEDSMVTLSGAKGNFYGDLADNLFGGGNSKNGGIVRQMQTSSSFARVNERSQ